MVPTHLRNRMVGNKRLFRHTWTSGVWALIDLSTCLWSRSFRSVTKVSVAAGPRTVERGTFDWHFKNILRNVVKNFSGFSAVLGCWEFSWWCTDWHLCEGSTESAESQSAQDTALVESAVQSSGFRDLVCTEYTNHRFVFVEKCTRGFYGGAVLQNVAIWLASLLSCVVGSIPIQDQHIMCDKLKCLFGVWV